MKHTHAQEMQRIIDAMYLREELHGGNKPQSLGELESKYPEQLNTARTIESIVDGRSINLSPNPHALPTSDKSKLPVGLFYCRGEKAEMFFRVEEYKGPHPKTGKLIYKGCCTLEPINGTYREHEAPCWRNPNTPNNPHLSHGKERDRLLSEGFFKDGQFIKREVKLLLVASSASSQALGYPTSGLDEIRSFEDGRPLREHLEETLGIHNKKSPASLWRHIILRAPVKSGKLLIEILLALRAP